MMLQILEQAKLLLNFSAIKQKNSKQVPVESQEEQENTSNSLNILSNLSEKEEANF
jgi:hypothetical protein